MPSITPDDTVIEVFGGVDTHQDTHTAAVLDQVGRVLGTHEFPATATGYADLLAWMHGSASRAPAPTARGWPVCCATSTSR